MFDHLLWKGPIAFSCMQEALSLPLPRNNLLLKIYFTTLSVRSCFCIFGTIKTPPGVICNCDGQKGPYLKRPDKYIRSIHPIKQFFYEYHSSGTKWSMYGGRFNNRVAAEFAFKFHDLPICQKLRLGFVSKWPLHARDLQDTRQVAA